MAVRHVIIEDHSPNSIIEIVRELRANGLVQGVDFDFSYNKTTYSEGGWEVVKPAHTVFKFYGDTKYATFFILKYGSN